jgi:hypothetical protein
MDTFDPLDALGDRGAGEEIGPELARGYTPQPRDPSRRQIVRVPPLPIGLDLPELARAVAELERVRGELAATSAAVAAANLEANGARQADAAAAAAAFRSGEAAGPSALDALYKKTAGLGARQAAGRTAVIGCEMELQSVLDSNRATYIAKCEAAIGAARAETAAALDAYADDREQLLATLTVRNFLAGERKFATGNLSPLRGLGSHDRPTPSADAVIRALRAELDWGVNHPGRTRERLPRDWIARAEIGAVPAIGRCPESVPGTTRRRDCGPRRPGHLPPPRRSPSLCSGISSRILSRICRSIRRAGWKLTRYGRTGSAEWPTGRATSSSSHGLGTRWRSDSGPTAS